MSRKYDAKRGIRFDQLHPLWPLTKKGTPYQRMPNQSVLEGIDVQLVPSVTDVGGILNGDSFEGGKRWVLSLLSELIETFPKDQIIEEMNAAIVYQRDKGSRLHEAVEKYYMHGIKPEVRDECQALELVSPIIQAQKEAVGAEGTIYCEKQFANPLYGGTTDMMIVGNGKCRILDWKFVGKKRKAKPSELAQIAAYCEHYRHQYDDVDGLLVICHTDSMTVRTFGVHPKGYDAFRVALMAQEASEWLA